MRPGQDVRLVLPENPRLNGARATVEAVTEWGAHVLCVRAATGRLRVLHEEMVPWEEEPVRSASTHYTGDVCPTCGGSRMRRSGSCSVCEECGSTSGCS